MPDWTHQSRSVLHAHLFNCTQGLSAGISLVDPDDSVISTRAAVFARVSKFLGPPWRFYSSGTEKYRLVFDTIHPVYNSSNLENPIVSHLGPEQALYSSVMVAKVLADHAATQMASIALYPEGIRQAVARTLCADCSHDGTRTAASDASSQAFMEAFDAFEKFYSQPVLEDVIIDDAYGQRQMGQGKMVWTAGANSWLIKCDPQGQDLDPLLAKV